MFDNRRPSILVIESNPRNLELIADFLNRLGYGTVPISVLDHKLEAAIIDESSIKLALVDVSGYSGAIWEWCEKIRTRGIQLLIISQKQSIELTNESIKHGASGVLIKPLVMKELTALIVRLLEGD